MDIKRNLQTYMTNFPGSFVGFFESASDILKELGDNWLEHAKENKNDLAQEWGNLFLEVSQKTKEISVTLEKMRVAFDKHEAEKTTEDPVVLIENFKNKVKILKDKK